MSSLGSLTSRRNAQAGALKWNAIVLSLLVACGTGLSGDCPGTSSDPCADGVGGDYLNDYILGQAVAVTLTNRSEDYVHLIGYREDADLCNRVDDHGGTRTIFVPSDFALVRVRAVKNGEVIDEILCDASGDVIEVVYSDTSGLQCVDFGD